MKQKPFAFRWDQFIGGRNGLAIRTVHFRQMRRYRLRKAGDRKVFEGVISQNPQVSEVTLEPLSDMDLPLTVTVSSFD